MDESAHNPGFERTHVKRDCNDGLARVTRRGLKWASLPWRAANSKFITGIAVLAGGG